MCVCFIATVKQRVLRLRISTKDSVDPNDPNMKAAIMEQVSISS